MLPLRKLFGAIASATRKILGATSPSYQRFRVMSAGTMPVCEGNAVIVPAGVTMASVPNSLILLATLVVPKVP